MDKILSLPYYCFSYQQGNELFRGQMELLADVIKLEDRIEYLEEENKKLRTIIFSILKGE